MVLFFLLLFFFDAELATVEQRARVCVCILVCVCVLVCVSDALCVSVYQFLSVCVDLKQGLMT